MSNQGNSDVVNDFAQDASHAPEDVVSVGRAFHQKRTCRIMVDSGSDIAPEVLHRLGVDFIPFTYVTPDGEREDDLWQSTSSHDFYEVLRKNPDLHYSTCAVTPGRYLEIFEKAAEDGLPTIYLSLSGGLSSSIHNAEQAAEMVKSSHPDFELYVVDTCCDSAAGELLAIEVVRQATRGLNARELYEWACEARYFIHGYFTLIENVDKLERRRILIAGLFRAALGQPQHGAGHRTPVDRRVQELLVAVEVLPCAIALDDDYGHLLDLFIGGEPSSAIGALAAAANGGAVLRRAGVDDPAVGTLAVSALHVAYFLS